MCYYKRAVFQCNHSLFSKMTRKCFLQLAYENGESAAPCGKRDGNPMQSIKVQEPCCECSAKIACQANKIAVIKQRVAEMKMTLSKISADGNEKGAVGKGEDEDEDETLSPVTLTFLTEGDQDQVAVMSSSSTGSSET